MNDLQKVIYEYNEIKARVLELENRLSKLNVSTEQVKWQPKGGNFWVSTDGEVEHADSSYGTSLFGTERQTKEQAERASVEMRRFNRLLALRDELCGDEVVNWSNNNDPKYRVYFSYADKMWHVSLDTDTFCENITPHFTTKELAQCACYMLNSGKVEL